MRTAFQRDGFFRHAILLQQLFIRYTVTFPADQDFRCFALLEQFSRAFRPFHSRAAQQHQGISLHRPAVYRENALRKKPRKHAQCNQHQAEDNG